MGLSRAPALGSFLLSGALLLTLTGPALAHKVEEQGELRLTIGWRDEPAYSGSRNVVEVAVADKAGSPVNDPSGSLTLELSFGTERLILPLQPTATPGGFSASLVPTRPGTYAFHITGKLAAQDIDLDLTCSEQTFDCVTDARQTQFPAKDPGPGELAERLEREIGRAEDARSSAARARTLSIVALGAAVVALTFAVAARGGRKKRAT